eukprot:CAMPEP_0170508020 /NCGR_PEP_ID=MMETSP0208-20121228/60943_1 /TAXON_ID=197538 /ORGANISM="Strombidium inclinatum, Strain S3" /LENGTH=46 /DNA_ID= /DNA_START= /DNA_END= /DNA_ORIENTATION=
MKEKPTSSETKLRFPLIVKPGQLFIGMFEVSYGKPSQYIYKACKSS